MYDIFFIIIFNYYIKAENKELKNKILQIHKAVIEYNKTILSIKNDTIKLKEINDIFFTIFFKENLNMSNMINFINKYNIPIELDNYVSNIIMLKLYNNKYNFNFKENSLYLIKTNDDIIKNYIISENISYIDKSFKINNKEYKISDTTNKYSNIWVFNSNNIFVVNETHLLLLKP
jgi:hypothetical protein